MFICWGFYWCNKLWIPKQCECTPSYIRYMVHIKHPPLSGSCGITSFPKFNGGEIGGLLHPSLLLTIIPIDFCCVMVDIYAVSGTSITTSTWVVNINGHTPLNIRYVITFTWALIERPSSLCSLASLVFPLENYLGLTHTNMKIQWLEVVVQTLILSSSVS